MTPASVSELLSQGWHLFPDELEMLSIALDETSDGAARGPSDGDRQRCCADPLMSYPGEIDMTTQIRVLDSFGSTGVPAAGRWLRIVPFGTSAETRGLPSPRS